MAALASAGRQDWWHYLYLSPYLLKWIFAFAAGWGSVYYRRWRKRHNEQIAQGWPSAEGRIVFTNVAQIPKTTRYLATLHYTYFVGEYHSGEYQHEFSNESDADNFVRALKDKSVQIRYKESDPGKSILEERVLEQHIVLTPRFG